MRKPFSALDSFETHLQAAADDLEILLPQAFSQELCEFYLNPRYLRGSDFLMRWSQGRWAEDTVFRAINATEEFRAVRYGPSGVAPSDPRELKEYFDRFDRARKAGKRPDLLILSRQDCDAIGPELAAVGIENVPFTPEGLLGSCFPARGWPWR